VAVVIIVVLVVVVVVINCVCVDMIYAHPSGCGVPQALRVN